MSGGSGTRIKQSFSSSGKNEEIEMFFGLQTVYGPAVTGNLVNVANETHENREGPKFSSSIQ